MSVTFRVKGVLGRGVEMSNRTARVVLGMLGVPGMPDSDSFLEGRMHAARVKAMLQNLSDGAIQAAVVPPRELGPNWYDHGISEDWLRSRLDGLRRLVTIAERAGLSWIVWD